MGPNESRFIERSKLRWFYAIAEFDNKATANLIYSHCNGIELQNFPTTLDLRFVHNCANFTNKKIRDSTEGMPLKLKNKPIIDFKTNFSTNKCNNMTKDLVYERHFNYSTNNVLKNKKKTFKTDHYVKINDPRFT